MAALGETETCDVWLNVENHSKGSFEHYYHFLLGFLVPVVIRMKALEADPAVGRVLIRSCGVLDGIFHELDYEKLTILDKAEHAAMAHRPGLRAMSVAGYDIPAIYDADVFRQAVQCIWARLGGEIDDEKTRIQAGLAPGTPVVLLINRGKPHEFYMSDKAEIRKAGRVRRSIRNFGELEKTLRGSFKNLLVEILEEKSFAQEIALLQLADVVIGQYGAGLANLIFARNGIDVFEITHLRENKFIRNENYFGRICESYGQRHYLIDQTGTHGVADVAQLMAGLKVNA
jgi:hypothetical protein